MVNWLKALGDNFSTSYLILSLFSNEDFEIVKAVIGSYGFISEENVKEAVIDYISWSKIDLFGEC